MIASLGTSTNPNLQLVVMAQLATVILLLEQLSLLNSKKYEYSCLRNKLCFCDGSGFGGRIGYTGTISIDLLRFIEIFAIAYWVVLQVMLVTVGVLVGSVGSMKTSASCIDS